ncbi:MAG: hypothetical protein JWO70_3077 [Betaproteobacteria bacterium]|nr:hypothetical protein [Betaproteobacteria bacterium]
MSTVRKTKINGVYASQPPAHTVQRRLTLRILAKVALTLAFVLPAVCAAADRFTQIVEQAGESTVNKGGFVVNQKRVAVQSELSKRPPTTAELGVKVPAKSALKLEDTARQIAQYHPIWRVYDFRLSMPRSEVIKFFEAQGLIFDIHRNVLLFPGAAPSEAEFIDGLFGDPITAFRVWRRP